LLSVLVAPMCLRFLLQQHLDYTWDQELKLRMGQVFWQLDTGMQFGLGNQRW
jgi:hypothetical protein